MLFIQPDKVRQIHSALITLSALHGPQSLPSRYVKILWLGTCVFYSHSGLLLTCQQLAPHLEKLFLLWFLFSYEYFMGHPIPPQSFQEKGVHSFILQWPVRQQPCASIHPLQATNTNKSSPGPGTAVLKLFCADPSVWSMVLGEEASPAILQAYCVRTQARSA